ncbi:MAG: hypothetical protein CME67_02565 [Halobacteriovoraceae bacterium]|nr:hypothetical protein [Peredibacter sp.]MBJ00090.1 hypothetical protein [Halobacteriovoraceae bacterium]|tara:strand:- start:12350 stop:13165 length:816 start_codon:yes stop_codon:yes gene_type:complete
MRILITACLIFANLSLANEKDDSVVAVVNGKKIKKSTLYKYHQDNLKFVRAQKKVTLESSLNDLINRIIGIDKARSNNLHKDPIVVNKMNDILYHAQISKDLEGELQKIKVSDKEVKQHYKNHPEYRTAHILFRLPANPTEEDVKNAFEKAVKVHSEVVKKPDTFVDYAVRFSQSSTGIDGGDLGYLPHTRLSPEFYESIKGKKKDTIIAPFRTQYGFHIVKILGEKTAEQINTDMYKKIIYDIKRDKIVENYFDNLRKKAKIKVYKNKLK